MKIVSTALAAVLIAGFASCDLVENPIVEVPDFMDDLYDVPEFGENTNENKNVMIEDFTGHVCGNCPGASVIMENLIESFPGRVFGIAVHAGSLAEPEHNGEKYTTDWRAPEGDVYWNQLDEQAYPLGRVNRIFGNGGILPPSLWQQFTEQELDVDPNVQMQLIAQYHTGPNHLNAHVETKFLNNLNGSYNIVICLHESHMFDWQLNYEGTGDPSYPIGDVEDYEFNHVLRGTVNGALGTLLSMDPQDGDMDITSYTYDYNTDWVVENTKVLAYVYNTETGLIENVVQSEIEVVE